MITEAEKITRELVEIKSVVGEDGCEQKMAEHILGMLSELSYFKENPQDAFLIPTQNDSIKRASVFCRVRGSRSESTQAVLLMGHIDTVEVSDFGILSELATKPDELKNALSGLSLPKEAADDLASGKYMYGRGALDMKSGVAAQLLCVKHFAEHTSEFSGNLLALFECDEEGDSHGMLTGVSVINDMLGGADGAKTGEEESDTKANTPRERLHIKCALCSDYSTERAAYLGTIGKYLPCFVAFGKPAHVGSVFDSVDPNLIISEIVCELDYNKEYTDHALGESSLPPVSLKQTDTKNTYSVQTAMESYAYFNWFSLKKGEDEILAECILAAKKCAQRVCEKAGCEKIRVYTLSEYAKRLGLAAGGPPAGVDIREYYISEAERMYAADQDRSPVVLVFMAGVCYPSVSLSGKPLMESLEKTGLPVRIFYPYISDASFVSLLGDVPVVNIGSVGKDAHTYLERVDKDYTFGELPGIILNFVKEQL